MNEYRYDINVDSDKKFGIEIEFINANLYNIEKDMERKKIPNQYCLFHKDKNFKFDKWCIDKENLLTKVINGNMIGGELSSRILTNEAKTWKELESVCNILLNNNAFVDENCGMHISIDVTKFINNSKFWEIFCKIIALMEIDINLFYMGECFFIRKSKYCSKDLRIDLLPEINKINFNDDNFFYDMRYCNKKRTILFGKTDGINLDDINHHGRMEIRYANGSLNHKIMQNNINFSLKLIESILAGKWDSRELSLLIDKEIAKGKYIDDSINLKENYILFENLVNKISNSEDDKNDFMKQYEKVLVTKK